MIQITSNELVNPDLIRRAVYGQDETGPVLALTMLDGGVRHLAGADASACWTELQARRVLPVPTEATAATPAARKRRTAEAPTAPVEVSAPEAEVSAPAE